MLVLTLTVLCARAVLSQEIEYGVSVDGVVLPGSVLTGGATVDEPVLVIEDSGNPRPRPPHRLRPPFRAEDKRPPRPERRPRPEGGLKGLRLRPERHHVHRFQNSGPQIDLTRPDVPSGALPEGAVESNAVTSTAVLVPAVAQPSVQIAAGNNDAVVDTNGAVVDTNGAITEPNIAVAVGTSTNPTQNILEPVIEIQV